MSWSWACYISLGNLSRLFYLGLSDRTLEVLIINTRITDTAMQTHAVMKLYKDQLTFHRKSCVLFWYVYAIYI